MSWFKSLRKFNGAVDPHWDTEEGKQQLDGGYPTFDHYLQGGNLDEAIKSARKEVELAKKAASRADYEGAIHALNNPSPHGVEFTYLQDKYQISGVNRPEDAAPGVRDFNDPRLKDADGNCKVFFGENGRIYQSDGTRLRRRVGWWWV